MNRQLALANAALLSSAVGLKRSFRRHAVIRQSRKPRTNAVRWLAGPHSIFWAKSEIQSADAHYRLLLPLQ